MYFFDFAQSSVAYKFAGKSTMSIKTALLCAVLENIAVSAYGFSQSFVLGNLRRMRLFSFKGQIEMGDEPVCMWPNKTRPLSESKRGKIYCLFMMNDLMEGFS
jgi:hypothetical protein